MKTIGIDIGGTSIKGGRFDANNVLEASNSVKTEKKEYSSFLSNIESLISSLLDSEVKGIGIVSAGDINDDHSSYLNILNIPCLKGKDLGKDLKERFNLPVYIENDAVGALVSEASLRKEKNIEMLTFGTGVGSAAIINGKPIHGGEYDFGHVSLCKNGYRCKCGKRGCSEVYLSAIALWRAACKRYNRNIEVVEVMDLYRQGDQIAKQLIEEYCLLLNKLIALIESKIHPELIILGGGLMNSSDVFAPYLKSSKAKIEFAKMGNKAGCLGASILIREELENAK
ncbi:MAG TPA: hypothetical protein DCR94_06030 [Firmicutes bacterium]|nr:hypothetical protein [Bacillota bacterium]